MTITIPWWFVYLLIFAAIGYVVLTLVSLYHLDKDGFDPEDWG